ncbi:MAG: sec-independent protein translocase protein TatC [Flavobacteriales bacterium]|jgi:sec-independent protein translocase protein TatC
MATTQKEMSFLDHLEVLRWTLMRSLGSVLIAAIGLFFCKDWLFDSIVLAPKDADFYTYGAFCKLSHLIGLGDKLCMGEIPLTLQSITMSGQFSTHIMVSFIGGFIIAFPVVIWEFWRFLKPGLKQTEKETARGIVFYSTLLFSVGVLFGYYIIAPLSVQFLGSYQVSASVANQISLNSFISTVTTVTLSSGLIFQLPILIYFLAKMGIVTAEFLRKYRKHALVVVLVLSAIITPPDITSQVLVALPILLLYEVSIIIAKKIQAKHV